VVDLETCAEAYASAQPKSNRRTHYGVAPVWWRVKFPEPLRGVSYYELTSEQGYQSLYDFLTGQAGVQPGAVGTITRKPQPQVAPLTFEGGHAEAGTAAGQVDESAADVYNRALRLLSDDRLDEALDALSRAIALDPTFALAYYNRGLAHYLKEANRLAANPVGEIALAIQDFDRALELGFPDAIVFRNRGNAYSRKGDIPAALADYTQAIALEPSEPLAYLNRGEVYANALQKERAIADYRAVLSLTTEPQWQDLARERQLALGVKAPRAPRGSKR
jgi:tetratricopeptide (TPR) repeat protein